MIFFLVFSLNLFWYLLIVKGLIRLFKGDQKDQEQEKENDYAKYNEMQENEKDGLLQNPEEKLWGVELNC